MIGGLDFVMQTERQNTHTRAHDYTHNKCGGGGGVQGCLDHGRGFVVFLGWFSCVLSVVFVVLVWWVVFWFWFGGLWTKSRVTRSGTKGKSKKN